MYSLNKNLWKGNYTGKLVLAVLLVMVSATLISAPKNPFNAHDRAYYASADQINFVRPGLVIDILDASIANDGTITAHFKLTDPKGLGLDRLGVTTPGSVSVSFIAATIPANATQYIAYTTRNVVSNINGSMAVQGGADSGGTFKQIADGEYTYTFKTKAPAGFDKTATHTIGAYGSRNLGEFDMGTYYDDDVLNFVPNGSPVVKTRDVIKSETCNKCHDQLAFHGGSRRTVELCILCHNPQSTDPDTGNTIDLPVMVHKIHTGANLPSVKAGGKYEIIGHSDEVSDYSDVEFPGYPDTRNCTVCHEQDTGAAQKEAYLKPSRAACGSCHDDVNFATGENHLSLPQVSDNLCANCHTPQGELEFDASIKGAHTVARFSRDLVGPVFEVLNVTDAAAGKKPVVTFSLKDKNGNPLDIAKMARLSLVLAGPTTDYQTQVSEDARKATGTGGVYTWTFANALPATAKGSYGVGIEGYVNTVLLPNTEKQQTVRDAGMNTVSYFSVDGSPVKPRRQVVSLAKCDSCHEFLSLHGDNRNTIEQCALCHNPQATDVSQRPATAGAPQSINFSSMIHRIHTGKELTNDFTIYGFGGSQNNFNEVGFPGDRRNCEMCHVNGSEQLPLPSTNSDAMDPRGPLSPVGPTTAACTGCHTDIFAASHALVNTSKLGESCAACHGPNADFSIDRVHAR